MGTLLKYLFYVFLIIVIYLLGIGFYEKNNNNSITLQDTVQSDK